MSEPGSDLKPMSFPTEVLSRISPELSLQRHLAIGLRPNLRKFEEFRSVEIGEGGLSRYSDGEFVRDSQVLGSSVVKSGRTTAICTITGGIIEEDLPAEKINEDAEAVNAVFASNSGKDDDDEEEDILSQFAPIYPVVEVERGRVGNPTNEEMILSQKLYEVFLHSGIISEDSLKVDVGLRSVDANGEAKVFYKDDKELSEFNFTPKRAWKYVLYANIKVFSRTGPLFDLVWAAVVSALKTTKLPRAHIDENAADVKIPVKMHGKFSTVREQYQIICDPINYTPLELNEDAIGFTSSFGVVDLDEESVETVPDQDRMQVDGEGQKSVLLCDLEGEEEEFSANKLISVTVAKDQQLKALSIIGEVSLPDLEKSITLAQERSKLLLSRLQ